MTTYSTSAGTKKALVMAAGELFTEYGVKAVTTRAIAKKAGENIGSIKYHFGGKDGLLDAVIDFALEKWRPDPLGSYLRANERLFDTRDGQARLVVGVIDVFLETIFVRDIPVWCGMLMFQILQRDIPTSKKIFDACCAPVISAFYVVYLRISGDNDQEAAFCWAAMIGAPAHLLSIDPATVRKVQRRDALSTSTLKKLRDMTVRSALTNLGLPVSPIERKSRE